MVYGTVAVTDCAVQYLRDSGCRSRMLLTEMAIFCILGMQVLRKARTENLDVRLASYCKYY
jgi:hypothetical protein